MTKQLTPGEQQCADLARKLWDEALITYQLPEDTKFVLLFKTKFQIFHGAKRKQARRAVGHAHYDRLARVATVTLNRDAIAENLEQMLNDTVAHEIAHIVCMIKPHFGEKHDEGWKNVCKRLGGTGDHGYAYGDYDMRIRKRRRYVYDIPGLGRKHVSDVKHKQLQNKVCIYRDAKTGHPILKEHWTGEVA